MSFLRLYGCSNRWAHSILSFKALTKRYCKDCQHFSRKLSCEDSAFLDDMLKRYGGHGPSNIYEPGRLRRLDLKKARFAELTEPQWCNRERLLVSAVDVACYAWQPIGKEQPRECTPCGSLTFGLLP